MTATTETRAAYRTETQYRTGQIEHRGHETESAAVRWAQIAMEVNAAGTVTIRIYSNESGLAFRGWIATFGSLRHEDPTTYAETRIEETGECPFCEQNSQTGHLDDCPAYS